MGGERDCLRAYELGTSAEGATAGSTASQKAAVHASLLQFDASKAQCYLSRDRHHLLAVIESGFGDCKPFNAIVRKIFCEALGIPLGLAAKTTEQSKRTSRGGWSARVLPPRSKQTATSAAGAAKVPLGEAPTYEQTPVIPVFDTGLDEVSSTDPLEELQPPSLFDLLDDGGGLGAPVSAPVA